MRWRNFLKVGGVTLAAIGMCLVVSCGEPEMAQQAVQVEMRDGVNLAADLYLPEGAEPFPTLVVKTPYNREGTRPARRSSTRLTATPF